MRIFAIILIGSCLVASSSGWLGWLTETSDAASLHNSTVPEDSKQHHTSSHQHHHKHHSSSSSQEGQHRHHGSSSHHHLNHGSMASPKPEGKDSGKMSNIPNTPGSHDESASFHHAHESSSSSSARGKDPDRAKKKPCKHHKSNRMSNQDIKQTEEGKDSNDAKQTSIDGSRPVSILSIKDRLQNRHDHSDKSQKGGSTSQRFGHSMHHGNSVPEDDEGEEGGEEEGGEEEAQEKSQHHHSSGNEYSFSRSRGRGRTRGGPGWSRHYHGHDGSRYYKHLHGSFSHLHHHMNDFLDEDAYNHDLGGHHSMWDFPGREDTDHSTPFERLPCPMLYSRIGHRCIAIFSIGQTSWKEAKSFCNDIFGDLITFYNVQEFFEFLNHLQISGATSDFWIGGQTEGRSWKWIDGSPMPMGSPYWTIRTDTLPSWGKDETIYSQAPLPTASFGSGVYKPRCASMSSRFYYYISDENCEDRKSPICVLRDDAEVVVLKDWVDGGDIPIEVTSAVPKPLTTASPSEPSGPSEESSKSDSLEPSEEGSGDGSMESSQESSSEESGDSIWFDDLSFDSE